MPDKNKFHYLIKGFALSLLCLPAFLSIAQPMDLVLSNTTIVSVEQHSAINTITVGPDVNIDPTGNLTLGAPSVYILPKFHVLNGGKLFIVSETIDVANDKLLNPTGLTISKAYPNPFHQSTRIDFNLEKSGKINIMVYDAVGKEITTLLSEHRFPGSHSVEWDATSQTGEKIGNGIYYIRFITENYQETKKAIFIR